MKEKRNVDTRFSFFSCEGEGKIGLKQLFHQKKKYLKIENIEKVEIKFLRDFLLYV